MLDIFATAGNMSQFQPGVEAHFYYYSPILKRSKGYPKDLYHVLTIKFHHMGQIQLTNAQLAVLMKYMTLFLVGQRESVMIYRYTFARDCLWHEREHGVHRPRKVMNIPGYKLLGVYLGNLITTAHLGNQPKALKKSLMDLLAPMPLEEVGSGLYWFQLPFEALDYCTATIEAYKACKERVFAVLKPHKVLWFNGRRKHF